MQAVITGGPSVGKTTIISLLAKRGYKVVTEFATEIIKEGKLLPWVDRLAFQAEVLRRQMDAESRLNDPENSETDRCVFLDRGLFDGEAYYIYDQLDIPSIFQRLDADQYRVAFLAEPLPFFERNDVRRENIEFTLELSAILEECYRRRNVEVIRVPALPPEERVDFVVLAAECLKFWSVANVNDSLKQYLTNGVANHELRNLMERLVADKKISGLLLPGCLLVRAEEAMSA